jgi:hypothetical protein
MQGAVRDVKYSFVRKAEDVEDHWMIGHVGGAGILFGYVCGYRAFGAWLSCLWMWWKGTLGCSYVWNVISRLFFSDPDP